MTSYAPNDLVLYRGSRFFLASIVDSETVFLRPEAGGDLVRADPTELSSIDDFADIRDTDDAFYEDPEQFSDDVWNEARQRRDIVVELARLPGRTKSDLLDAAAKLGERQAFKLLRAVRERGPDVRIFLPANRRPRAKRLRAEVERIIKAEIRDFTRSRSGQPCTRCGARSKRPAPLPAWRHRATPP